MWPRKHAVTWAVQTHMSNSDTHVCTRGTHIRIRLKQYTFTCGTRINVLSWKTNMCFLESTHTCVHLEHTYVFTYDTLMCSRETHMCAHLEHNETPRLRAAVVAASVARWSSLLACAAHGAFAESLCFQNVSANACNLDGPFIPFSELLSDSALPPPVASRLPR